MRRTAWLCVITCVAGLVAGSAAGQDDPVPQDTVVSDTLAYFFQREETSNVDLAVALSQDTPLPNVQTVLLGRDDLFADSLASGVAQGQSPLLLVPPQGPVPAAVLEELQRLSPSQLVLLGGPAAISDAVADELAASFDVSRAFGASRIETAVAVAGRFAPSAQVAIIARAFDAGTGDATQAFADALAAGALAADLGAQVLLTETAQLSEATLQHILESDLQRVVIVGGTAAVSAEVEAELAALVPDVDRLAGGSRAETAVAIAEARGLPGAGAAARVILADSRSPDAWAAGFAAASHAALFEAPMLLTDGPTLPPATEAYLETGGEARFGGEGAGAGTDDIRLVCLLEEEGCLDGRAALGLPAPATVTFLPEPGAAVSPTGTVRVTVDPPTSLIRVSGDCVSVAESIAGSGDSFTVDLTSSLPADGCTLDVEHDLTPALQQHDTVTYEAGAGLPVLISDLAAGGAAGGDRPAISADADVVAFTSAGEVVAGVDNGRVHLYVDDGTGPVLIDVERDGSPASDGLEGVSSAPQLTADGSRVAFTSSDEDLDPGVTATSSLETGYVADVATGDITLVSFSAAGVPSNGTFLDISDDGTVVTYQQQVAAGGAGRRLLRRDLTTGAITTLPISTDDFRSIVLSGDGRLSVLSTTQGLVQADSNGALDTYVYDWSAEAFELVSVPVGAQSSAAQADDGRPLSVSADGRFVTFTSTAQLDPLDENVGQQDVYLRDRQTATTRVISRAANQTGSTGVAGSVSRNGEWVAFTSNRDGTSTCGVFTYATETGSVVRLDDPETAAFTSCAVQTEVADDGTVLVSTFWGYVPADVGNPDVYRFN